MNAHEPGLLGNLPKSRPGTRSAKRGAVEEQVRAPDASRASSETPGGDPVGSAVRGAAKLAGAGLRAADGATRHVLRHIPRP